MHNSGRRRQVPVDRAVGAGRGPTFEAGPSYGPLMRRLKLVAWTASVVVPSIMAFTACSTGLGETTAQPSDDPAVTVTGGDDDITVDTFPPARPSGRPSDGVDATAANDAVPAGMELEFESANFDLDENGDASASLVAPIGWSSRVFTGVQFEPEADAALGFFTRMKVDAGCDGLCEVTDWEERLTGPDGYLTMLDEGDNVVERRDVTGSAGVVRIVEDTFGTTVIVLRWDDSADHYFQCEAILDDGAQELAEAFEAACLASRPDWFEVG